MDWNQIVEQVTPSVVKIETPDGHVTGFLCFHNEDRTLCGIATADHVVSHADRWQQPIRIQHHASGESVLLTEADRVIFRDADKDSAFILMQLGKFDFPEQAVQLLPADAGLVIGSEVGWIGYPAITQNTLCFFSGSISARLDPTNSYLIDGVAINGVSGGPVMYQATPGDAQIVGLISAYIANRATGETLPGLCFARDVSHFHKTAKLWKNVEDAARAKKIKEQSKETESDDSPEKPPATS